MQKKKKIQSFNAVIHQNHKPKKMKTYLSEMSEHVRTPFTHFSE